MEPRALRIAGGGRVSALGGGALVALALAALGCTAPPDPASFPWRPEGPCPSQVTLVRQVEAEGPLEARRKGIDGWVILSGLVAESGWVEEAEVLAAYPEDLYERAALAAFSSWRFTGSVPRCEVRVVLRFRIY